MMAKTNSIGSLVDTELTLLLTQSLKRSNNVLQVLLKLMKSVTRAWDLCGEGGKVPSVKCVFNLMCYS